MNKKRKVGVVSLGCDKNRVDSEVMLQNLTEFGFELTNNPEEADAIVVNSCAFLESARKEAIETVLEMANYKQTGNCKLVVLTGCLGQHFGNEVFEQLTEADIVLGVGQFDKVAEIIDQNLNFKQRHFSVDKNFCSITEGKRVLTTQKHFAYLKIADGCNNYCSYCLIPYIRGKFRSRKMESIVSEANELAEAGVKELILVAQDVTRFGSDIYGSPKLVELIEQLSAIEKIQWIRLLYCYPELVDDRLIETISTNPKLVKYIDIPLQHVDDEILKLMHRRSNFLQIEQLFDKLKEAKIDTRTTFICGFPGETKQSIDKIKQFLKKYNLRNAGFFAYSREKGTKAFDFNNQVRQSTKEKYVQQLYQLQLEIAESVNCADVGKTLQVIVDENVEQNADGFVYVGRTEFMSPYIDGVVYVHSKTPLEIGSFCKVHITDACEYDLVGDVVN